jgi:tripartite-type tricarboxylate transporter receptor subunit TctC
MKSSMNIGFGMIRATAAALMIACLAITAHAQEFPNRTGRMIVPYPAGGTTDVLARRIAEALRAKFGQTFVVENKPARRQLGVQELLRAPADGHTLLMATATICRSTRCCFEPDLQDRPAGAGGLVARCRSRWMRR